MRTPTFLALIWAGAVAAGGQDKSPSPQVADILETNAPPIAQPADPASPGTPPVAQPVGVIPEGTTTTPAAGSSSTPETNAVAPSIVVLNPAVTRFDAAMASFNAGQYAEAVSGLSAFLRDFPQDRRREEALYRLAESYRSLGRTSDALAAYTYEIKEYPEGPLRINAQLRRGAILSDAGKMEEAIPPLREVADKADGELQEVAHYLLGRAFLATQKETEGRALLQALADAPTPGKYAGASAQILAELDDQAGRFPEAVALWQRALDLTTDAAAQATLAARGGWSALQANQPAAAEKFFQTARRLDATGSARKVANTGLLRLLFQQKRYGEWVAIYSLEQNNLLDSARSEILYDLGQSQFTLKHWPQAAEAFDQFLREFGTDPSAVTAAYERFLAGAQIDRGRTVPEAEAYLKGWPQSPYRARVQLLEAQELSVEKKFSQALPLWKTLAQVNGDAAWPHRDILLELARSEDELQDWAAAAPAYQNYLDDLANHPGTDPKAEARQSLQAEARLALALQNTHQFSAAAQAWQEVQSQAAPGSPDEEMALESLGLIYAKGGPSQAQVTASTFHTLLDKFPQTPLRALAAFTVGDSLFQQHDYAGAEKYLLEARTWDPAAWRQPATQRLVLGAYGMKAADKALTYLRDYDAIPQPADPLAREAVRLPAAFDYWLAEEERKGGQWNEAEDLYARVTQHPAPGDLLAGAWWQLGQVQSQRKEWPAAVSSYEKYRQLKPETKDATVVLLACGRAQLGAGDTDEAKALGQQALLQEPEGPNSAAARTLLAETALASHNYTEAARMFATLAVLFDDSKITPQAMARASDAFAAAGDAKSAGDWRQKLQARYPGFQPAPYL